jgi:mono/diheme cytochrome c family protein
MRAALSRRLAVAALVLSCSPGSAAARLRSDVRGEEIFATECAPCHGPRGRGDGPEAAYFAPPPRDLHEGFLGLYATDELVARIRTGAPLTIDVDPAALRARRHVADDIAAHVRRLPDVRWDEVRDGVAIYEARCERCHGPYGRPLPATATPAGTAPRRDLADPALQRATSDTQLLAPPQHRRAGVAVEAPTGRADARALLAYLRLLSPGFELYSVWCSGCHGDDGRAEGELAEGARRPNVVLDRRFLRRRDADELRRDVIRMLESQEGAMPHLQHRLTEEEARQVVEYLRRGEDHADRTPDR